MTSAAEIFLSYSREDQATARLFAQGLEREGFSVWWDQTLRTGENYDRVTESALRDAKAVIVLWSKTAVDSQWVRAEATTADRRGTLLPVMIEPCERPIMFELKHTAELGHWNGAASDPAWRAFVSDVQRSTGKGPALSPAATAGSPIGRGWPNRPVIIGIAVALLAGAGLSWFFLHPGSTPEAAATVTTTQSPVTLAVLPFANLSGDPAQEYFSDGLTEEILNQLAQIPALRLTGRTSSFSFKGKNEDLRVIGEKLHAANILEGSVRRDGKQLRVTAQLIRAEDGTHMWSKTYDRGLDNVFAVQDEIAKDVAQALSVKLDVTTLNRSLGGTTNVEAYDRYLRWRNLALSEQRGVEVDRQQEQLLREAVALDPQFAVAWGSLAQLLDYLAIVNPGAPAERLKAETKQIRDRVEALAPDSWMVRQQRAYGLWEAGKWPEAIAMVKGILDSGPFTLEHAYPYINLTFAVGRFDEGIALVDRVKAIEPLLMYPSRDQQWNFTAAGRITEAEAEYQRSKSLNGSHAAPDFIAFLRLLAREDADPQALRVLHRKLLEEMGPRAPAFFGKLGELLHDRPGMRAFLKKSFEAQPEPLIRFYADALGDAELSLAALRGMWKGPSPNYWEYWELFLTPYSGMRSLPGYKELMRQVGLVDYWQKTGDWGDVCRPVGKEDFECR